MYRASVSQIFQTLFERHKSITKEEFNCLALKEHYGENIIYFSTF